MNLKLEDLRRLGIIDGYGGPDGGPFMAQRGPKAIGGPGVLQRKTQGGLALAIQAWWEPVED